MSYYDSDDQYYLNNGYQDEDSLNYMSEDSYNGGNGYNNDYNNGYGDDDDSDESSEKDGSFSSYECNVSQDQFHEEIKGYLDHIWQDRESRLYRSLRINLLRKQMLRVYARNHVLFCIDVEAWEQDPSKITEIGVAIYDPRGQELSFAPFIKKFHFVIDENKHLLNGKYVPNNRDHFVGGTTWKFPMEDVRSFLENLIDHYFNPAFPLHCSLVGHDLQGDLKWLDQLGVYIPGNVRKLDTKTVFAYTHGHNGASLKNALKAVRQPLAHLHNAGNDAYYTILLALSLCDPNARHLSYLDYHRLEDEETSVSIETLYNRAT